LTDAPPDLSIVVPMHNEAGNVEPLYDEIVAALAPLGRTAEILVVDDGSTDETFERLRGLHARVEGAQGARYPLRVLRLGRRFGKAVALDVAFRQVRGGIVFTLDGDLQDDPKEIPRFLAKLDEGCDLVSGWKRTRHDPASKVVPSRIFNAVVSRLTGIPLHDFNCGFKAYRGEVVRGLRLYGGLHRFIPVLADAKGFRIGEIEVEHRPRTRGRTKYGFARLLSGPLDLLAVLLLTRFAGRPLRLFGGPALVACLAGLALELCVLIQWLAGDVLAARRPAFWVGALLILLGTQLLSVGLIAELIVSHRADSAEPTAVVERLG